MTRYLVLHWLLGVFAGFVVGVFTGIMWPGPHEVMTIRVAPTAIAADTPCIITATSASGCNFGPQ